MKVSRGEDGGNEAGAAAEQEQRLAKKALAAIVATRQSLGLLSLRCADNVDWEEAIHFCERLRRKAKQLRPVSSSILDGRLDGRDAILHLMYMEIEHLQTVQFAIGLTH